MTTFFDTELMEQFTDQTQGQMYRNPSAEELQELGEDIKNQSAKDTQTVYMFTDTYLNDSLRPWLLLGFLLLLISTLRELLYKRRV